MKGKNKLRSEKDLLSAAKNWRRDALTEIYDRYNDELYAYAMRRIGNPSLAEECVAETFHRFLDVLRRGKGPERYLRAYLYRTAHNWLIDQHRRGETTSLQESDDHQDKNVKGDLPNPLDATLEKDRTRETRSALEQITPDQRQALTLRFIEGWSLKETARAMERSVGAVKALQHRGLAAMRRVLGHGDNYGNE